MSSVFVGTLAETKDIHSDKNLGSLVTQGFYRIRIMNFKTF